MVNINMINKRAWIKIAEASIAIMIIASILLFVYAKTPGRVDVSDYAYDLQTEILQEIASNSSLRNDVLVNNTVTLEAHILGKLPDFFDFKVIVCDIDKYPGVDVVGKDIFVEDRIISGDLDNYGPMKLRFFIWQK